jgi:transformation/transcription domain-associated protein
MTLPLLTQYTAVRTLLTVVDVVFQNKDGNPQVGRDILVRILKTLVDKLSALQTYRSCINDGQDTDDASGQERGDSGVMTTASGVSLEKKSRDNIDQMWPPVIDSKESLRDLKSMVQAIVVGHKTLIWYINNYRAQREKENIDNIPPIAGANEEVASAMLKITHSKHALIDKYIVLAFPCMKWLKEEVHNRGAFADNTSKAVVPASSYESSSQGHYLRSGVKLW